MTFIASTQSQLDGDYKNVFTIMAGQFIFVK